MSSRAGSEGDGGRDRDSDEETHSHSEFLGDKWFSKRGSVEKEGEREQEGVKTQMRRQSGVAESRESEGWGFGDGGSRRAPGQLHPALAQL